MKGHMQNMKSGITYANQKPTYFSARKRLIARLLGVRGFVSRTYHTPFLKETH
jgi:hypothetical protein